MGTEHCSWPIWRRSDTEIPNAVPNVVEGFGRVNLQTSLLAPSGGEIQFVDEKTGLNTTTPARTPTRALH